MEERGATGRPKKNLHRPSFFTLTLRYVGSMVNASEGISPETNERKNQMTFTEMTVKQIAEALENDRLEGWVWANGFLAPHDSRTGNIGGTSRCSVMDAAKWLKGEEHSEIVDEEYDENGNAR